MQCLPKDDWIVNKTFLRNWTYGFDFFSSFGEASFDVPFFLSSFVVSLSCFESSLSFCFSFISVFLCSSVCFSSFLDSDFSCLSGSDFALADFGAKTNGVKTTGIDQTETQKMWNWKLKISLWNFNFLRQEYTASR